MQRELDRLLGAVPGDAASTFPRERFRLLTANAASTLANLQAVLRPIVASAEGAWPDESAWRNLLPPWFLERFAPELTSTERSEYLTLPAAEKLKRERWTLNGWLYWMSTAERPWRWFEHEVIDDLLLDVTVVIVGDWMAPLGALRFTFESCGAHHIEHCDS